MSIKLPKISEIEAQGIARLKQLEPKIETSWYGKFSLNLVRAFAAAAWLVCLYALGVFKASFVQTSKNDDLERHASETDEERKAASAAFGLATVYGVSGTVVPILTEFRADNGLTYIANETALIADKQVAVTAFEVVGDLVWLTVGYGHGLTSDADVVLTGFAPAAYNAAFTVVGVDEVRVCIELKDAASITQFGVIEAAFASLSVECTTAGLEGNLSANEKLRCDLIGVDFTAAGADGLTGGAEIESDYYLQQRIIKKRSIIEGVFTAPQVELAALSVAGNTRAWVVQPERGVYGGVRGQVGYRPLAGEVVVYVVRDEDGNIEPSDTVLALTKSVILVDGKKTCHTTVDDVFVLAPTVRKIDVSIENLNPNTAEMRGAIVAEYEANMADLLSLSDGITVKQIEQFVLLARDATGRRVIDFSLALPSSDIAGESGVLLTAGDVKWI